MLLELSGVYSNYIIGNTDKFCKSKNTYQVEAKLIEEYEGYVPHFASICPFCDNENIWGTTGLWPSYITCGKCKISFLV